MQVLPTAPSPTVTHLMNREALIGGADVDLLFSSLTRVCVCVCEREREREASGHTSPWGGRRQGRPAGRPVGPERAALLSCDHSLSTPADSRPTPSRRVPRSSRQCLPTADGGTGEVR